MTTCIKPDCNKPTRSRGLCKRHYERWLACRHANGFRRILVDAEPVREHIRWLQSQRLGWRLIADLAGVDPAVVSPIIHRQGRPVRKRVHEATAYKIFRVRPPGLDALPDHSRVSAADTHRLLQDLMLRGFTAGRLGRRLGWTSTAFAVLMRRDTVRAVTARKVRDLAIDLRDTTPPCETQREWAHARRSIRRARALGWVPYDWGDEEPVDVVDEVAVERVLQGKALLSTLTASERILLADRAKALGMTPTGLSKLANCSWRAAKKLFDDEEVA